MHSGLFYEPEVRRSPIRVVHFAFKNHLGPQLLWYKDNISCRLGEFRRPRADPGVRSSLPLTVAESRPGALC